MLIRLIYVSTATRPLGDEDLEQILAAARDFNRKHGITGMLVFSEGNFLQILEGEDAAVTDLMDKRIAVDPRHRNILVLDREPIAARDFPDWRMGFRRLDGSTPAELAEFRAFAASLEQPAHDFRPGAALDLLKQFAPS